jgi:hypothetical protein
MRTYLHRSPFSNTADVQDAEYDARTVSVPADVFRKLSPSQQQYWETKKAYLVSSSSSRWGP